MCEFGQKVGYKNCTWEPDFKVVKTISATCAGVVHGHGNCPKNFTIAGDDLRANFKTCPGLEMTPPAFPWNQHL